MNRLHAYLPALLAIPLLACLTVSPAAGAYKVKELPPQYQAWLDEVDLLITKQEKAAFLEIEKDYQRDAFIERFWQVRDPYSDTSRNEFRQRWMQRVTEARQQFGSLDEDRSRVLLLNGFPDARLLLKCHDLWPAEVWYYARAENLKSEITLLFYQSWGKGPYRLFQPADGLKALSQFSAASSSATVSAQNIGNSCGLDEGQALRAALRRAFAEGAMGFTTIVGELMATPKPDSEEWVAAFNAFSTDLPANALSFDADLQFQFPGRHQTRTVVQMLLAVLVSDVKPADYAGHLSYNFLVTGEILREGKLFDNFRYQFNLPAAEIGGDTIPMVFERNLRPGDYQLILKLEDLASGRYFHTQEVLTVPYVEQVAPVTAADSEAARWLDEANQAITSGETTLKIVPPRGDLHTGMLRIDTLATGTDIAKVTFAFDGQPILTKRTPPFSVELDLGSLPRMRTLSATAYNLRGEDVARDQLQLNAGSHRFAVRLIEPRRGQRYVKSLRAEASVQVPEGQVVEKMELFLNETLVATLYQEPWAQPILLPADDALAYVRVVAYQPDGNTTEDTVFINAPDYMENLEIQFVELYIAALDKDERPVDNLTQEDFTVWEDDQPQQTARFDEVGDLPIHAGIMLDISASMEGSLDMARQAALSFFEQAITPRDRAMLITFNDFPFLAVKFSNQLSELAGGLAGLKAERGTAFYDSLVFALYYFNGIRGQRALILLSDGKDEHSRFTFEDTLEYARRAGVAIYSIGLDLPRKEREARKKLTRVAEETGGRSFMIEGASELPAIYAEIQRELRSRYYLAYQSTNTTRDDEFRSVRVEVGRPDVKAKTLRGYYP